MSRSPVKRNPDWNAIRRDDLDDYRNRQIESVHYHAGNQLDNLKEHAKILVKQAEDILNRVAIAEKVLSANFGFKPVLNNPYFLYRQGDDYILTVISPEEEPSGFGKRITKDLPSSSTVVVKSVPLTATVALGVRILMFCLSIFPNAPVIKRAVPLAILSASLLLDGSGS